MQIAVLFSGQGSNLLAIHRNLAAHHPDVTLLGICNNPDAPGVALAKSAGVPVIIVDHHHYPTREGFEQQLIYLLHQHQINLVVLAGFMRKLTPVFVEAFIGRLINIHPSVLPKYPGLHTHKQALMAKDDEHGCTVHFVTEEIDAGPIIAQVKIPIEKNDTEHSLQQKIQQQEHRLYPLVVGWFCHERVKMLDGRVVIDGFPLPETGITVPAINKAA